MIHSGSGVLTVAKILSYFKDAPCVLNDQTLLHLPVKKKYCDYNLYF